MYIKVTASIWLVGKSCQRCRSVRRKTSRGEKLHVVMKCCSNGKTILWAFHDASRYWKIHSVRAVMISTHSSRCTLIYLFFLFWMETWHIRLSLLVPELFIWANGSKINNMSRLQEFYVLNTVHRAICNNCLNTWTFIAQLVSSIIACIPHQSGNERWTKNSPKQVTHLLFFSPQEPSEDCLWGARCGVSLKPLHVDAPTAVGVVPTALEWARKPESKANRRVASLHQWRQWNELMKRFLDDYALRRFKCPESAIVSSQSRFTKTLKGSFTTC